MEKLIILYSVGDECTYSCSVVEPLVYESVEKALFDLELLIEQHIKDLKQFDKDIQAWQNRRTILESKKEKQPNWMSKHYEIMPKDVPKDFVLGKTQLDYSNFIYTDYNGEMKVSLPDIITVEQWYKKVS